MTDKLHQLQSVCHRVQMEYDELAGRTLAAMNAVQHYEKLSQNQRNYLEEQVAAMLLYKRALYKRLVDLKRVIRQLKKGLGIEVR